MDSQKYKAGFFMLLSLFILFWLWILLSVLSGTSPRSFIRRLFAPRTEEQEEGQEMVSPSFYEQQTWIEDISPDGTSREALSENGNKVTIRFAQPMDTSSGKLNDWSVQTGDLPLDFSHTEWTDPSTFVLMIDRSLEEGEFMILKYQFRTAKGELLPSVVLNYE